MAGVESISAFEFLLAVSGGFLPSFVWLWFWLREDRHPEPRKYLILTFFGGMLAVVASFPLEYVAREMMSVFVPFHLLTLASIPFWAAIEEVLKYFFAWFFALRKSVYDEPVDALIYLITAALGFASLENMFFILTSFSKHGLLLGFVTGNLRFIGASLLHITTSAVVGVSIAFSFFHKENHKRNVIGGVILASVLHFVFNYFILKAGDGVGNDNLLQVFIPLWIGVVLLLLIFEKVKRIQN